MLEKVINGNILKNFSSSILIPNYRPEDCHILAKFGMDFHLQQSWRFQDGLVVHWDLNTHLCVVSQWGADWWPCSIEKEYFWYGHYCKKKHLCQWGEVETVKSVQIPRTHLRTLWEKMLLDLFKNFQIVFHQTHFNRIKFGTKYANRGPTFTVRFPRSSLWSK